MARYAVAGEGTGTRDSATLLEILTRQRGGEHPDLQVGVKRLSGLVAARVDHQTNIVSLSVEARYPELAAAVANNLVAYLNDFNARTRQSQARQRRMFVEERVAEAQRDLGAAEDELRLFYERNRLWQQSPQLAFEEGRLRRQVDIRKEIYLTLKREYETARIEEVNDAPVITILEEAIPPRERSAPKRAVLVMLAVLASSMVTVLWAFGAEYVAQLRHAGRTEYSEFQDLVTSMKADLAGMLPIRKSVR
ncbi:MAG TPA: GNVR domain-containing protein [Gemmatimonadales bacterium]|nr:GNVR domain-containing protein [Gemmatimonadales bacterium]